MNFAHFSFFYCLPLTKGSRQLKSPVSALKFPQGQGIDINKEMVKKNVPPLREEANAFSFPNDRRSAFYTSYSKLSEVKLLTIGIASPLRILQWAEKTLPNGKIYGEVLNPNTLHHKTFKPQKGGLFCERIFGPLKDFECACGKSDKSIKFIFPGNRTQPKEPVVPSIGSFGPANLGQPTDGRPFPFGKAGLPMLPDSNIPSSQQTDNSGKQVQAAFLQHTRKFCPDCDVEYTWSVIRRYQLGYIKLNSPVAHIWFLRGTPSYLSILLDIKKRHLQYITYCSETFTLENSLNNKGIILDSPSNIFESWQNLSKLSKTKQLSSTLTTASRLPEGKKLGPLRQPSAGNTQFLTEGHLSPKRLAARDNPAFRGPFVSVKEKRLTWRQLSIKLVETVVNFPQFSGRSTFGTSGSKEEKQVNASPVFRQERGINSKTNLFTMDSANHSSLGQTRVYPDPLLSREIRRTLPEGLSRHSGRDSLNDGLPETRQNCQRVSHSQSLLAAFQVSIYYKSAEKRNLKANTAQTFYTPSLVEINKKLPIDFYILNTLERILHKASLILSIKKTWQQIYKNSYTKAFKKVVAFLARQKTFYPVRNNQPEEPESAATTRKTLFSGSEGKLSSFSVAALAKRGVGPEGSQRLNFPKQRFAFNFCARSGGFLQSKSALLGRESNGPLNNKKRSFLEDLLLQRKAPKGEGRKYLDYDSFGNLRLSSQPKLEPEPEEQESFSQTVSTFGNKQEQTTVPLVRDALERPLNLRQAVRQLENSFVQPPFRKLQENNENKNLNGNLSFDPNEVNQSKNNSGQPELIDGLQVNTCINGEGSIDQSLEGLPFEGTSRREKAISRTLRVPVAPKRCEVIKNDFRANVLGTKRIPSVKQKVLNFSDQKDFFKTDQAKCQYCVSGFYEVLRNIDSFSVNKLNAFFQKSNKKNIGLVVRTIKKYFINMIFICLQKLKQPILLLDSLISINFRLSSITFLNENINQEIIESRISLDFHSQGQQLIIQSNSQKKSGFLDYFLLNTDLIEIVLTKAFLRPLLLAQLFFQIKRESLQKKILSSGVQSIAAGESLVALPLRAESATLSQPHPLGRGNTALSGLGKRNSTLGRESSHPVPKPFRIRDGNTLFIADQVPSPKKTKAALTQRAIALGQWPKRVTDSTLCGREEVVHSFNMFAISLLSNIFSYGQLTSGGPSDPFREGAGANPILSLREGSEGVLCPSISLSKEFKSESGDAVKDFLNKKSINKIQQRFILTFYKTFSQIQGLYKKTHSLSCHEFPIDIDSRTKKANLPIPNSFPKGIARDSKGAALSRGDKERNFVLPNQNTFKITKICPSLYFFPSLTPKGQCQRRHDHFFSDLQVPALSIPGLGVPAFFYPEGRTNDSKSLPAWLLQENSRLESRGKPLLSSFFDTFLMDLFFCLYKSPSKVNCHPKGVAGFLEQGCLTPQRLAWDRQSPSLQAREVLPSFVSRSKGKVNQIYNNVYTLSHRERWQGEKDWQFFSIFNNSLPNYSDIPIFSYKNRIFAVSQNSFLFNEFSRRLTLSPEGLVSRKQQPLAEGLSQKSAARQADSLTQQNNTLNDAVQNQMYYTLSNAFYSGPGIVQLLLNELNFNELKKLDKQNRLILYELNKQIFKSKKQVQVFIYDKSARVELKNLCKKRDLLIRRTKLVRKLFRNESGQNTPSSMILTVLPVLPPDLRPIVKMGGESGQIAASDFNRLYQRVIYRNDRLKKFLKDTATNKSYEMKYAQRLLQEAVDNLMQNGKSGANSEKDARGRALKSLSDILKGKQGRFRQFLLGKRVDYSGRSVIVVGPKLKLHECGLPLEMARELYLPFLLKIILNKNYAKTVIGAKTLIKNHPSLAYELLREIMQVSPILLNRAPTLHRLGIQAFVPKLIEGRAILLHPLVCAAFNADFDGDQMAVHVPITVEARAEAWKLMLSRNNLLSPATGDPLAIPSQDMVLGCYYLTTSSNNGNILPGSGLYFKTIEDVLKAYNLHKVHLHAIVWVKWADHIENGNDQEEPIEIRLSSDGHCHEISSNYYRIRNSSHFLVSQYMSTTPGRLLFNSVLQKIM